MDSGTPAALRTIWGSSPTDLWVGGMNGLCRHYDGATWTPHDFTNQHIDKIRGLAADAVFALTTTGMHYFNGQTWLEVELGSVPGIADIWIGEDGSALAVDDLGLVFRATP